MQAPSCRCAPGDRHPLCDLHGETAAVPCTCQRHREIAADLPDIACPVHGLNADPYGAPAPERRDPWLTHYDPFVHGRL